MQLRYLKFNRCVFVFLSAVVAVVVVLNSMSTVWGDYFLTYWYSFSFLKCFMVKMRNGLYTQQQVHHQLQHPQPRQQADQQPPRPQQRALLSVLMISMWLLTVFPVSLKLYTSCHQHTDTLKWIISICRAPIQYQSHCQLAENAFSKLQYTVSSYSSNLRS